MATVPRLPARNDDLRAASVLAAKVIAKMVAKVLRTR